MLIRGYNLIDIKNYELNNRVNILSYFDKVDISHIIELIRLGNGKCSHSEACDILDEYLASGGSIVEALYEIKEQLIGTRENSEASESNTFDITEYESLTDLYIYYSMQLLSVGLSYQEFWSMNTKEMYKVFNSIVIKMENETNRELNNYHTLAAMVGAAVWGKLQKKAPKVNMSEQAKLKNMDAEDAVMVAQLKAFAAKHNRREGLNNG